jgi:hypothetical protein
MKTKLADLNLIKRKLVRELWTDMSKDRKPTLNLKIRNGKSVNIGFINQYSLHSHIPNKWFDWENRVNAQVMIIGQDWGPYSSLQPYITEYEKESNTTEFDNNKFLFKTFSSRTEKFILSSLQKSYIEQFHKQMSDETWDNIVFTMAVLFTRQGNHFRGNEFYDEKFGLELSLQYLQRQIEIIQPKIIVPFGGAAWGSVQKIFKLENFPNKITDIVAILNRKPIVIGDTTIIPNFHPASHTDPKIGYEIWKTIWKYL